MSPTNKVSYLRIDGRLAHRVIMERLLGRSLTAQEVVHHDNENPRDNRPENLILLPSQAEHARIHATKNRLCERPDCERKHYAKGMCGAHYQEAASRARGVPPRQLGHPPCTAQGCDRPTTARGLCNLHYKQWRVGKEVMPSCPPD